MRNCLILGSGRSGTSMVAGTLASAGYSMGEGLHLARASNPKGFFEAPEINQLNEELLAPILASEPRLGEGQRWLGIAREGAAPQPTPEQRQRMVAALASAPYCFKDPRFSFTLPAWRPLLADAALVCVFRHPARTAQSLVEECRRAPYLADVEMQLERALELWSATYRRVLEEAERGGDWLFLHYDQMLTHEGHARLGEFLEVELDESFADPRLRRALPEVEVPREALELYAELCRRAAFEAREESAPAAGAAPQVSVLCLVGPEDRRHLDELIEDVRAQRGVSCELVLVDRGRGAPLECAGASIVRCDHPSRGVAWKRALQVARGEFVALQLAGCRALPARLAHALDAFDEGVDLVACDYVLTDAGEQFLQRSSPESLQNEAGPFFESGLVLRRDALLELDERAYFPVERALYARLWAAGRAAHQREAGFSLPLAAYHEAWARSRDDVQLVRLAELPRAASQPALSVSLCTYQRREVLEECLESFARQLVAPGSFEIVLVNDGSSDGTRELVEGLELLHPLVVVQRENGGLAAARNSGLALARGELVLFVNDDTIAAPDLVEQHITAHARHAGESVCILGTFEQPAAALEGALMRHLEGSREVFDFAHLEAGPLDGVHFYTCNVSAPLAEVRAVGGFDPSFRHYGCEDTDLGLRLEHRGCTVHHEPRARAWHHHLLSFEDLRRRQRTVARAYVRLFRKHPALLERWKVGQLEADAIVRHLATAAGQIEILEGVGRELSALDVGRFERLGGAYAELAHASLARLGETIASLNGAWWSSGYLEGLREHGLAGFPELLASGLERRGFALASPHILLAWPRWRVTGTLELLFERLRGVAADGFAGLVLIFDPERDGERDAALAALERASARVFDVEPELEIVLEDTRLERSELLRLGRSVDALVPLGGEPEAFLEAVGCERLASEDEIHAWRERFSGAAGAPLPREVEAAAAGSPELSVIVATHDRPRELEGLLDALAAQTLDPRRFEVIVIDDASRLPARAVVAARRDPFELEVLRQEGGGPGVARNLGLARARGETVVFLNDDALPAPDCLQRHRLAQRLAATPRAVLGTFELTPERRVDSFALLIESSNELFAQPLMRPGEFHDGLLLCTGNVSLPRAALQAVGGFDERYPYAGGEDSELGLRLHKALGIRVQYDPAVRCGHDHDLDVLQLARRKRVLGWMAYQVTRVHPDAGVLEPGELEVTDWEALASASEARRNELTSLVSSVQSFSRLERARGVQPNGLAALRELVARIGRLEFQRGLLCAHEGCLPSELADEFSEPLDARPSAPEPPAALPGKPTAEAAIDEWFDSTEGMISREEARHLFELAAAVDEGVIVEVGSYRGRSTASLARGAMAGSGAPVFAVEPHEAFTGVLGGQFGPADRAAFYRTMLGAGCAEQVRLINISSEGLTAGWERPVGLLWIDGDHSYEGVRRDWECWVEKLVDGAMVLFDDASDPRLGPAQLIAELEGDGVLELRSAVGKVRGLCFRRQASRGDAVDAARPVGEGAQS